MKRDKILNLISLVEWYAEHRIDHDVRHHVLMMVQVVKDLLDQIDESPSIQDQLATLSARLDALERDKG